MRREEMGDIGPDARLTLSKYRGECQCTMYVVRFSAVAADGENPLMYNWNNFQRNIALDTRKRRWLVLRKWCAGIMTDSLFADMPFVQ